MKSWQSQRQQMNRAIIVVLATGGLASGFQSLAEAIAAASQPIEDLAEMAEAFEREIEARKLENIKMQDIVMEMPEREKPEYRPKLMRYDKRRNFAQKPYWNRIRSNPKLR